MDENEIIGSIYVSKSEFRKKKIFILTIKSIIRFYFFCLDYLFTLFEVHIS
jgi:hypothetical protein